MSSMRLLFCFLVLSPAFALSKPDLPNIVIIVTDDQGAEAGVYGDAYARTPFMDRLAEDGVLFSRAYVTQSSCSPCRSSIVTGMYPHQSGQVGLSQFGYTMREAYPTFFTHLKPLGYHTGWFGKSHVDPHEVSVNGVDARPFGSPPTIRVKETAEAAEAFIRESGDRPFLLYYNLVDPHAPYADQVEGVPANPRSGKDVQPWPWIGLKDNPRVNDLVASYYNALERADRGVGYLMEVLERTGTAEDTLVIMLGDNGAGFPRAKGCNYNASTQTVFLVRWPARIAAGQVRDELVSVNDILPTVLDAVGLPIPEHLPGASILPLCQGETVPWRDVLFTQHTSHPPTTYFPRRTAFDGRHLLIWNLEAGRRTNPYAFGDIRSHFVMDLMLAEGPDSDVGKAMARAIDPPEFELMDLKKDPAEFHNFADDPAYAEVLARLQQRLRQWQEATNDPLRIPENLRLMSEWHDNLLKVEEPHDSRGRPLYLRIDYVQPLYRALMARMDANMPGYVPPPEGVEPPYVVLERAAESILRRMRLEAGLPADPNQPVIDASYKSGIHWVMADAGDDGFIRNRITDGPYAENHLQASSNQIVIDPNEGRVLRFAEGDEPVASLLPLDRHRGIRITMRLKIDSPSGQSIILGTHGLNVFKVARTVRFRSQTAKRSHWSENEAGGQALNINEWVTLTAELNPAIGTAFIQVGDEVSLIELEPGDVLHAGGSPIILGQAINAPFTGAITEVKVEVMD